MWETQERALAKTTSLYDLLGAENGSIFPFRDFFFFFKNETAA